LPQAKRRRQTCERYTNIEKRMLSGKAAAPQPITKLPDQITTENRPRQELILPEDLSVSSGIRDIVQDRY